MKFLAKLERKFGKYAIRHLTRYIIICYVIGYVLEIIAASGGPNVQMYLALVPGWILKGQIWRLVSWWLIPPTNLSFLTFIMLFVYYQLGTILEKVWGDFYYNLYIFLGLLGTVVGAFIMHFCGGALIIELSALYGSAAFSTYFVSLSIFFGFALTFPEERMMLFFIIPIKVKYLALFDAAYLTYQLIVGGWMTRCLVISSLAATFVFFLLTGFGKMGFGRQRQSTTQKNFNAYMKENARMKSAAQAAASRGETETAGTGGFTAYRHRCCICGRTELDAPELEFRYCSKCNGDFEYCQDHLFTHVHKQ